MLRLFWLFFGFFGSGSALLWAQPLPDRLPLVGKAVDEAGKPLRGVTISLRRQDEAGPYAFWGASTTSDESGKFRFSQAETGRYYLSGEAPGFAPINNQSIVWNASGGVLRVNFTALITLQLQVKKEDDSPLFSPRFWLRLKGINRAGQLTQTGNGLSEGVIRVENLIPDTYSLFLTSQDGYAWEKNVDVSRSETRTIRLQTGGQLRAVVREDGAGEPGLGGARLSLNLENPLPNLPGLSDPGEDIADLAAGPDISSLISRDGDGSIALPHFPPGHYLVRLRLPGFSTAEPRPVTVVEGELVELDWKLTRQKTELAPAIAALTLQLKAPFPPLGTELALRVLPIAADGTLLPPAWENRTPFTPRTTYGRRALVDGAGQVRLFPLSLGRYRVFAALRTPGADLENGSLPASVVDVFVPAEGATASLMLKPSP